MMHEEPTMFGKLLSRVGSARKFSRIQAINELWDRNGMLAPASRKGYKIEEARVLHADGTEAHEYRLYKLVDATVVTVTSVVETTMKMGLDSLDDE